jgi:hypothetical protein
MKLHSQPHNPSFHFLSISASKTENWHIVFDSAIPELIPSSVGQGTTRKSVQNRTLALWAFLASAGLEIFYQKAYDLSQNFRAAWMVLVFLGAGFVACANITGALSFVMVWVLGARDWPKIVVRSWRDFISYPCLEFFIRWCLLCCWWCGIRTSWIDCCCSTWRLCLLTQ